MRIHKTFGLLIACLLALFSAGCAVTVVGSRQSETPPRMVQDKDGKVTWNDASLFGPVPAELVAAGNKTCGQLDSKDAKYEARGYHAKALMVDGRPFKGGGYFCVQK
jgi:hypothetical protein